MPRLGSSPSNRVIDWFVRSYDLAMDLAAGLAIGVLYLSGVARYRMALFLGVFCLFRSTAFSEKRGRSLLRYSVLPVAVYALYGDLSDGPLWPVFEFNSLLVALCLCALVMLAVPKFVQAGIDRLAQGELFVVCPACRFSHSHLTDRCEQCGFTKTSDLSPSRDVCCGSPELKGRGESMKVPPEVYRILRLAVDETVLLLWKIRFVGLVVEGERRTPIQWLVVTNKNLTVLNSPGMFRGWTYKKSIVLSDVVAIVGTMKKAPGGRLPFLIVGTASGGSCEIVLASFDNYKEKMLSLADTVRQVSEKIDIRIDVPDPRWTRKGFWKGLS